MKLRKTCFKWPLSLPTTIGLAFVTLDMIFWIYWPFTCITNQAICGEGALAAYGFHLPSSMLAQLLPGFLPNFVGYAFIFILGIIQYFLIGYVIGLLINFIQSKI